MARHREDSAKAQAEVDRLLDILRQMENEKNDKDRKISELERSVYFPAHHGLLSLLFLNVIICCIGVAVKTCYVFVHFCCRV